MHFSYALGMDKAYHEFKEKMVKLGFEFQDPDIFIEDDTHFLVKAIASVDELINNNPEMITVPDQNFVNLVNDLVDGVDIS